MEEENVTPLKRTRKAPIRFDPWRKGDPHPPMAERKRKSKEKKEQKKYREMRKNKNVGDVTLPVKDGDQQGSSQSSDNNNQRALEDTTKKKNKK